MLPPGLPPGPDETTVYSGSRTLSDYFDGLQPGDSAPAVPPGASGASSLLDVFDSHAHGQGAPASPETLPPGPTCLTPPTACLRPAPTSATPRTWTRLPTSPGSPSAIHGGSPRHSPPRVSARTFHRSCRAGPSYRPGFRRFACPRRHRAFGRNPSCRPSSRRCAWPGGPSPPARDPDPFPVRHAAPARRRHARFRDLLHGHTVGEFFDVHPSPHSPACRDLATELRAHRCWIPASPPPVGTASSELRSPPLACPYCATEPIIPASCGPPHFATTRLRKGARAPPTPPVSQRIVTPARPTSLCATSRTSKTRPLRPCV